MKRKRFKKTIAYGLAAVALFAILAAATFRDRADRLERQQVQIVTFGDSVFGQTRDDTSIPAQVGRLLGKTVFNGAFGGSCIGRVDDERLLSSAKDSVSLAGLTKAVAAGDFGVQQTFRSRENGTDYFPDTVDQLEAIDFSNVELVLIQHGLNDYYNGIPIYNEKDSWDEYTFTGALRCSLAALRRINPDMRILLVTPTYTWYWAKNLTCEEYDAGYGVQEDYIRAEMEVAEEFGIEVLDVYHDVFPHETWADSGLYTLDGMHPNEAGRELLAGIIADYLLQTAE